MRIPRLRVIGLGQPLAGDDAVGLEVVRRLRDEGAGEGVELLEAADASELLTLLETPYPVVVLDAVVGMGPLGAVIELDEEEIGTASDRPLSAHGLRVSSAIALARDLFEARASPSIALVGVRIGPPSRGARTLSSEVLAAMVGAMQTVRARIQQCGELRSPSGAGSAGVLPHTACGGRLR